MPHAPGMDAERINIRSEVERLEALNKSFRSCRSVRLGCGEALARVEPSAVQMLSRSLVLSCVCASL